MIGYARLLNINTNSTKNILPHVVDAVIRLAIPRHLAAVVAQSDLSEEQRALLLGWCQRLIALPAVVDGASCEEARRVAASIHADASAIGRVPYRYDAPECSIFGFDARIGGVVATAAYAVAVADRMACVPRRPARHPLAPAPQSSSEST